MPSNSQKQNMTRQKNKTKQKNKSFYFSQRQSLQNDTEYLLGTENNVTKVIESEMNGYQMSGRLRCRTTLMTKK